MQRWEYVVINVLKSYGMNWRANGDKRGEWKDQPLHFVLNEMGKAGFEMVAYDGENYIFKRPARTGKKQTKPLSPSQEAQ